ncbi:MAG: hypothetical protein P1U68_08325 [Verrucomicrobiales bacterium]|nr:hypothetical protein [Verrucomicrobiales bacterium]
MISNRETLSGPSPRIDEQPGLSFPQTMSSLKGFVIYFFLKAAGSNQSFGTRPSEHLRPGQRSGHDTS